MWQKVEPMGEAGDNGQTGGQSCNNMEAETAPLTNIQISNAQ